MDTDKLRDAVRRIKLTDEARSRIKRNCAQAAHTAKTSAVSGRDARFKRPAAAAVALSLCLCLTAMAAAAGRFGFLRSITNWSGAVTGEQYEQASGEIAVQAAIEEGGLVVTAVMLYPDRAPYFVQQSLGIESYSILDMSGNTAVEGGRSESFAIANGRAEIMLPLDGLPGGEYRLIIDAFIGSAKAEQPLVINGRWECVFILSLD